MHKKEMKKKMRHNTNEVTIDENLGASNLFRKWFQEVLGGREVARLRGKVNRVYN